MTATILDGRALATELRTELQTEVQRYTQQMGHAPSIVIVRVEGDAASGIYGKTILRAGSTVGIQTTLELLPATTAPAELQAALARLNHDPYTHGILVQMPLPTHIPAQVVIDTVSAEKDIDGISLQSAGTLLQGLPGFLPSTTAAVMEILAHAHTPLAGKHAVVVGRSNVVGKPLALLLLQQNATVTLCHSRTENLAHFTRQADVLVAAVGRAQMITADMVRPGATVIDVGINARPEGGIVGDVDFAAVSEIAGAITPVPGGVGPLTNVVLMRQCVQAAWHQAEKRASYE